jgi:hypothetical protein
LIGSPAASSRLVVTDPAAHKREVNDVIFTSLKGGSRAQTIGFFCECRTAGCFETVLLSADEYEVSRRSNARPVRAPGH